MHGMLNYFLRRIALVPVTFLVITFMVYSIIRLAPGGPIEQLEQQLRAAAAGEAGGGGPAGLTGDIALTEDDKEELRRYYNLDRPIPIGYLQWLGAIPKEKESSVSLEERQAAPDFWRRADELWRIHRVARETLEEVLAEEGWLLQGGRLLAPASDARRKREARFFAECDRLAAAGPRRHGDLKRFVESRDYLLRGSTVYVPIAAEERERDRAYFGRVSEARQARDESLAGLEAHLSPGGYTVKRSGRFYHVSRAFSGILEGEFGWSNENSAPALDVIFSKFPISIYFGLIGYLASWIVCIPLGVFKAIRHRSLFDTATSVVVFFGYSLPGFVACLLLLVYFGGGSYWNWFPLAGFRDEHWDEWWQQGEYLRCMIDQVEHTAVPVFGYLVGAFASMTILMKNSLLDNLGADYVRTAFAKGLPEKRVIFVHALRNSLIPITAGIGYTLGLLFAGSFLIEYTCGIPGMGLLGYESLLKRDYAITLGILVFLVLIRLVGNIISDLVWALIDPRIRFQ